MAQTTQFTAPGWHYLDSSSGYLGGNRNNGSYVSLKSTNNRDYSTIIETIDASAAQTLNFTVTGGLSTGAVHVWSTNTRSNNAADYLCGAATSRRRAAPSRSPCSPASSTASPPRRGRVREPRPARRRAT